MQINLYLFFLSVNMIILGMSCIFRHTIVA